LITEVKSDQVNTTAGAENKVVVDLGLAIGEAARIVGVSLSISGATIPTAPLYFWLQGVYSFDPEDCEVENSDDEQFAHIGVSAGIITASVGMTDHCANVYFDYSHLSLVTTRNLALICAANGLNAIVVGKVYYERYKPSVTDLNMLIATRR